IWEIVEKALRQPEIIAREVAQRQCNVRIEQDALERERRIFAKQVAQCEKELHKWEQAYLTEAIDVYDFKVKKAEVMTRQTSLEQELARLDAQQRLLEQTKLDTASLIEYCERARKKLCHFDLEEKRLALEALNITVVWHHDKAPEIQGSIPLDIASGTLE